MKIMPPMPTTSMPAKIHHPLSPAVCGVIVGLVGVVPGVVGGLVGVVGVVGLAGVVDGFAGVVLPAAL